ncbi:serine-rich adhesin for platelets-like [Argopecten irradians]|uniref:serine-rich adhesin for platelets-like n=1 Tax=Argopecten irradians TaxID=31199 RepID=UPI00371A1653
MIFLCKPPSYLYGPAAEQPERLVFIDESSTELSPLPFCSATSRQGPRPSSYLVVWSNLKQYAGQKVSSNLNTITASNITIPARLKTTFSARDLGLHAETNYSVKYKIFYSMGEESDYSDEIYIDIPVAESRRLQSNAESTRNNWNTVATVMGVVVLGLTILIILVYKARRKWIKIDDNIESVTIPRPVSNEQFYQEQNTPPLLNQPPDSGHGTLSSVPTQETVPPTTHLPDIPSNDMSNESQNYLEERDWDELHGENVSLSAAGALPSNDECSVNIVNKSEVALVFSKKPTTDYIQVGNRGISNDVSDESQNYLKERDGDGDELHGENVSVSAAGALPSTDECNVNIVNKSEVAVVFSKKPTTDYIQVGNRGITMPTLVVSNPDYTQNTTDDAFPNSTILSLESFVNNHDTFDDRNYQSSMQTYVQCFVNYQHTTELNDPNVMPQNICINARSDTFSDTLDACKTICSDQTLTNSCQNQQNSEIDTSSLIKGEETQTTYHSTHQVTHDTSSLIKGEETENTCHSTHQLTYDTSSLIKGEETQTTYHSTHQLTYDTSPLNKEEETENTCHSTHQLTCDTSAPNKGEETQTTYNSTHQVTHDTSSSLIKGEEIETTCHSTHQVTHDTSSSLIKGEEIETTCHSTHQVTHDTSSSLIKGEEIETTCHSTHQVTHDTSSLIKGEETENTCHSTHQLTYDISSTTKGKKTETTCHSTHQVTHENFVHDDYVLASFIESQHSSNPNN